MVRLIPVILTLLAGAASASDWRYGSFDNGSWFEAHVSHVSREVAFHCGGRSLGGQPLPQSDEPMITQDYALDITLRPPGLGASDGTSVLPPRGDIVLVAGTTGYQLPRAVYDELNLAGWIQPVGMGDPLIAALREARAVAVDAGGSRLGTYGADGLADAMTHLIAFCDARWYALGVPVPATATSLVNEVRAAGVDIAPRVSDGAAAGSAPQAATRRDDGLWNAVQAYIARSCNGSASAFRDGYARAANLDGDGVEDYVIAWDAIDCAGPMPRPFCGASQCAVDVFVSSHYAPGTRPATVYAAAVDVGPGPVGRDVLKLAGRLANCNEPDAPPDCIFHWAWRNGQLERIR